MSLGHVLYPKWLISDWDARTCCSFFFFEMLSTLNNSGSYVCVSVFSFFFCYHHLISGEVCISCLVLACIICTSVFWSDHVSRARSTVGPQKKLFDRRDLTSPLLCTIVCFSLKSLLNRSEMISWREGQPKKSWKKLWSDVEATKVPLRSVLQSTLWWWPPLSSHHLFILASCLWEPPPSQYTAAQHCSIPLLSTYKWNLFYLMFSTEFPSSFLHFLLLVVLLCLSPAVVSHLWGGVLCRTRASPLLLTSSSGSSSMHYLRRSSSSVRRRQRRRSLRFSANRVLRGNFQSILT